MQLNKRKIIQWLSAVALVASTTGGALQAATPAGTQIRNQASATYLDSSNRPQVSTSNEVINVVAPIYALEITPDETGGAGAPGAFAGTPALTQSAAAGNIVYYSYYLQNQSNISDTYQFRYFTDGVTPSRVRVFVDVNGDGQITPGDFQLIDSGSGTVVADSGFTGNISAVVGAGQSLPIVVEVTIPTNAGNNDVLNVDIDAISQGGGVTDLVGNFNRTTVVDGKGILSLYKGVNLANAVSGNTLTYTIQGSNVGSVNVVSQNFTAATDIRIDLDDDGTFDVTSGILIVDNLDAASIADFVDIESINLANATSSFVNARFLFGKEDGVGQYRFYEANTLGDLADPADIDRIAIYFPNRTLAPGQAFTASFSVNVESNSNLDAAGAPGVFNIENTATAYYNDGDDDQTTTSNRAITRVDRTQDFGSVDVRIGPYVSPFGAMPPAQEIVNGSVRASLQHPSVDNTAANTYVLEAELDVTTVDNRNAGEVFSVPLTIRNTGLLPESYTISSGANTLPGAISIYYYKSDGVTPLGDTTGDGQRDTGEVAVGADVDIIVRFLIPANYAGIANAGSLTVLATAFSDAGVSDDTVITIATIRPAGVDIARAGQTNDSTVNETGAIAANEVVADHDDANPDDSGTGGDIVLSVAPGSVTPLAIDVRNVRTETETEEDRRTGAVDTYTMTWGVTANGGQDVFGTWQVSFYRVGGTQPVSDTGDLNPDTLRELEARVSVPAGFKVGTYILNLNAISANNPAIMDTMYVSVTVAEQPLIKIDPDNTATVLRGGTYTFRHVLSNLGNTDEDIEVVVASTDGYQAVFVNADGTVLGTTITSAELAALATEPGDDVEILVRVFIPQNAPVGSSSIFTVTATGSHASEPTDTAVDIVQVIDGNLQLTKANVPTTAVPPGDNIEYTTSFTNLGSAPISEVMVIDQIPSNTRLVVTAVPSFVWGDGSVDLWYSTDGGVSWIDWTLTPPADSGDGTNGSVTHLRFVLDRDLNGDEGVLLPGEDGNVTFTVKVR